MHTLSNLKRPMLFCLNYRQRYTSLHGLLLLFPFLSFCHFVEVLHEPWDIWNYQSNVEITVKRHVAILSLNQLPQRAGSPKLAMSSFFHTLELPLLMTR